MNKADCNSMVDSYLSWLRAGLSTSTLNGACELTTPFLDRHNDHLQIYAQWSGDRIVLSDDGYIIADLEASGMEFNTPKRDQSLTSVLNGFGVRLDNARRIMVDAVPSNLGQRMHSLLQAMIAVNDTFVLAQPRVASFFWEDVRDYLAQNEIRFSPRIKLSGRSGYDHAIDFLVPASPTHPERLVQAINNPSKNTIGNYLFTLSDTVEARGDGSIAVAVLNDETQSVSGDVVEALDAYSVVPVLWSEKGKHVGMLRG